MSSNDTNIQSREAERFLAFSLKEESYAVPLLSVKEVIAIPEITPVPHTPPHFRGIMNLRGQIISVVDLRLKFNVKQPNMKTDETSIIICDIGGLPLGVVVCSVNSVLTLQPEEIKEKPPIAGSANTDYITGVAKQGDKLVLLIDIALALDVKDHAHIKQATTGQKAA